MTRVTTRAPAPLATAVAATTVCYRRACTPAGLRHTFGREAVSGHLSHERPRSLRVGIDIGGTFTDFLLTDDAAGKAWVGKTLTTPDDPSSGVERGLDDLL